MWFLSDVYLFPTLTPDALGRSPVGVHATYGSGEGQAPTAKAWYPRVSRFLSIR